MISEFEKKFGMPTKTFKTSAGVAYHYLESDAKDTLVLLNGYSASSYSWNRLFLQDLLRKFRLVLVDHIGTGDSDHPKEIDRYTIKGMSADLEGVRKDINIEKFFLCGYSMGGCVAMDYVLSYPNRVIGLGLVATKSGGNSYTPPKDGVLESIRTPEGSTVIEMSLDLWSKLIPDGKLPKYERELVETYLQQWRKWTPRFVMDAQLDAYIDADCSRKLGEISIPTIVLTGDLDQIAPIENSKYLSQAIPNAELAIFEGCGHMPHIEARSALVSSLINYFTEV